MADEIKVALQEIKQAFTDAETNLKGLLAKQSEDIKKYGETTTETAKSIGKAEERLNGVAADLVALKERVDGIETKGQRFGLGTPPEEAKSLGTRFVESDAYKSFAAGNYAGKSAPVEVGSFYRKDAPSQTLDGGTLGNVPGYLYTPERLAEIIAGPDRMQRVRDLIPVLQTGVGSIEYVREKGFTNAAAPVAEKGVKPASKLEFEIVSTSVKTIAHWLPATRQILSDAAQLRSYIDSRLITGLKLVEDAQILYGDGQGANLQGIMTDADVQTYDQATRPNDTKVDAVRRAMTRARVAEYPVTGVVLHPYDWEDIELLKGDDKHYIWVSVTDGGVTRLWRAPVVETTAINAGEFLTGAFSMATALWDREEAAIRASESHSDFFIRNMTAILAEERLAQTIYRPEGFVVGTFTGTGS